MGETMRLTNFISFANKKEAPSADEMIRYQHADRDEMMDFRKKYRREQKRADKRQEEDFS